jgi:uncharacterized membrane protein
VSPRIVDLVAALATGAVGSVALARSDISDTLPGVAIAISLVPPLCVVGLTLESGAVHQSLGALLLFTTNVIAILASGVVVMALYRAGRLADRTASFRRGRAVTIIAALLILVLVPLAINSTRTDRTAVREADIRAVAQDWSQSADWTILGVTLRGEEAFIQATGPDPAPSPSDLRENLDAAGLKDVDARLSLAPLEYRSVTR